MLDVKIYVKTLRIYPNFKVYVRIYPNFKVHGLISYFNLTPGLIYLTDTLITKIRHTPRVAKKTTEAAQQEPKSHTNKAKNELREPYKLTRFRCLPQLHRSVYRYKITAKT